MRDRDRDITEKIALGMQTSGKLTGEAMFDQRLFNQVKRSLAAPLPYYLIILPDGNMCPVQTKGIDAGFVDDEDDDNVYTKAFRPDAAPVCDCSCRSCPLCLHSCVLSLAFADIPAPYI